MNRSASTWAYNVCVKLLEVSGVGVIKGYFGERQGAQNAISYFIENELPFLVKFHFPSKSTIHFLKEYDIKNIFTYRDPRDASVSYHNFFDKSMAESVKLIKESLELMDLYKKIGKTIFIKYEDFYINSKESIKSISEFINLEITEGELTKIDSELSRNNIKKETSDYSKSENIVRNNGLVYSSDTNFHQGHIASGEIGRWKKELNQEDQDFVNEQFAPWIKDAAI